MKTKKIPTTAIIDADIILYKAACYLDIEGLDEMEDKLESDIKKWTPEGVDTVHLAVSCSRKSNFRRSFWKKYKSHRDSSDSPDSLGACRDYILEKDNSLFEPRLEADDLIGIHTSSQEMIGVTIDKDLKCVPGYHWNPDKDKDIRFVSVEEADRFFYTQWMPGDSTDGIPGLWRVGPKKAEKFLDEWAPEEWQEKILELYDEDKYQPKDGAVDALSMARCVRILRDGEYDFETKKIALWSPIVGYNDNKEK